jgi:hypothetical protein
MKKLLCVLVIAIAFTSCQNDNVIIDGTEIKKVRGCEYIKSHVYLGSVYTHCGDCNNPIHKVK